MVFRMFVSPFSEQALEDVTLDDIDINNLDKELDNDTNSLSSSISAGLSSGEFYMLLTLYHKILTFKDLKEESFGKPCGRRKKCW